MSYLEAIGKILIKPLKPIGNYMCRLLQLSLAVYLAFMSFISFSK
jgi:hypothetical protein